MALRALTRLCRAMGYAVGMMLGLVLAAFGSDAPVPTLPLDDPQGRLIVSLRLNGKGPYRWLLQTASVTSVIDPRVADDVGLEMGDRFPGAPLEADVRWRRGARLEGLGEPVELRAVGRTVPAPDGVRLDGVLGYDLRRQYAVAVDPVRKTVRFLDRASRAGLAGATSVPWRLDGGMPRVRARLVGSRGAPWSAEPFLETGSLEAVSAGASVQTRLGASVSVQLGATETLGVGVTRSSRPEPDWLSLGHGFLRRQPYVLDYPGSKLMLGQPYPPGMVR